MNKIQSHLIVLAPDKASGEKFNSEFAKYYQGKSQLVFADIRPRVLGEAINPDPMVAMDLAKALADLVKNNYVRVVIACNTLQIWLPQALKLMDPVKRRRLDVYSSFRVMRAFINDSSAIWLGTSVTAEYVSRAGYATLHDYQADGLQTLTQELIWRIKAVYGMDYSGAIDLYDEISNRKLLEDLLIRWQHNLKTLPVSTFILGCTELALGVEILQINHKIEVTFLDPSIYMAKYCSKTRH